MAKINLTESEFVNLVQNTVRRVMAESTQPKQVIEKPKTVLKIKLSELKEVVKQILRENEDSTDKDIADYEDNQSNKYTKNFDDEEDGVNEAKPSAGMSKGAKSNLVKKAKAGEDIGKKGKGFQAVADKAAKEYGSKEAGERVAASAMWKNAHK